MINLDNILAAEELINRLSIEDKDIIRNLIWDLLVLNYEFSNDIDYKKTGRYISSSCILHYLNGKIHKEDGPAAEYDDGLKMWYFNEELHREDGPAVEYLNGKKRWFWHGKEVIAQSNEHFLKKIKLKCFW